MERKNNTPEAAKPRVGIISFVTNSSHLNYGATLHGYAFQKFLKTRFGIESEIIDYFPKALIGENLKYPILNKRVHKSWIIHTIVKINWLLSVKSNRDKWNKFRNFIKSHLRTTPLCYDYSALQTGNDSQGLDYDVFVCEADVIWKLTSEKALDENFFLDFPAAQNRNKVAYAPTVAARPIEGDLLRKVKQMTSSFRAISAREAKGAEYLSTLLDRKVEHVLDPTLLLDEKDYADIIKEPEEKERYLLIYTCTVNDREMVKEATRYGRQHNLKVIEISNYTLNRFVTQHSMRTDAGIEEWLGYFKNAELVCTNSFHGLCFCVLFRKNFFLFERDKNDFRMPDICEKLGLSDRLIPCGTREIPESLSAIDYDDVYKHLSRLRTQSADFIKRNIVDILK